MKLSGREKAAYGIGAVGKDMVYSLVSGYLMYYYNTVLGISATFIGILFMAARVFDALNDPFMGAVVEKTNTKMGKFRPWLLVGTVLNAIVLFFMFSIPQDFTGKTLLIYASVFYVLWGVTYTIMDIPYWSMIPAITEPGADRENLSVIARSCSGVGYAVPTALTMLLVPILGGGSEWAGFRIFAGAVAVFFVVSIVITVFNVKERNASAEKKESATLKDMIQMLVKNDQALVVVISIILFNASLYLTQQLALYFFKYDIGRAELYGLFGTVGGAAQIVSMMSLPALRKKFSCITILKGAIGTTIFGYALLFALGTMKITNMALLCVAAVIIFLGFGLATVLTTIFLADTVDYGEWKMGKRGESVIFSLQTFVVKLASAISVLIAGVGLDVIGLDKEAATQSAGTLLGMRILMIVVPIVGLVASILYFGRKYKLTEERVREIVAELKERNRKNG